MEMEKYYVNGEEVSYDEYKAAFDRINEFNPYEYFVKEFPVKDEKKLDCASEIKSEDKVCEHSPCTVACDECVYKVMLDNMAEKLDTLSEENDKLKSDMENCKILKNYFDNAFDEIRHRLKAIENKSITCNTFYAWPNHYYDVPDISCSNDAKSEK